MKFVPVMVTLVPVEPLVGEKLVIVGVLFAGPKIVKLLDEMLKKTFPTASTFTRAEPVGVVGMVTVSEPSLGVLLARTIGKVKPPSVESRMRTAPQLTGAFTVLA